MDLEDLFPLMGLDWNMPTEITGVSVAESAVFKGIDEELGFY
jgi:hypothetical protein